MKILLDEGVPDIIQKRLTEYSISTVEEMGLRGVKNGALLDFMIGRFRILVTTDKNLPHQQNLQQHQLSAIILPANDVPSVIKLLPQIEAAIKTISSGEYRQLQLP